jgi:hypothetical protein
MKKKTAILWIAAVLAMSTVPTIYSSDNSGPLIADHTCTDLSLIPMEWIDSVQANRRLHYAHTSHGGQLTTGLSRIRNSDAAYDIAKGNTYLPGDADAFCIFDGQEGDTYITPDEYWGTATGMNMTRNVLNHNPTINTSMWSWCCQLNGYSETETQAYLDSLTVLETEYPKVTFIYMTCNAQGTGAGGYNRYLRNEQIRRYCIDRDKVLFDFADLDSWFNPTSENWEHATYQYNGHSVPVEHPQFHGSQAAHTTYGSCEQKGKAVWWMMAKLAGWGDNATGIEELNRTEDDHTATGIFSLEQNRPNPFNLPTSIRYLSQRRCSVKLTIYSLEGQLIKTLYSGEKQPGVHTAVWNGVNKQGEVVASGVYFYQLQGPNGIEETKKMLFLK